jgi:hypothetical protein
MKAVVVGNCVTVTYGEALQEMLPDWEVKRADLGHALAWLSDGSKPEFTNYLATCDLYVGHPITSPQLADTLNPSADRIIIPPVVFRGLHPDIAILPGFTGLYSSSQTSLIVIAARALDLRVDQTVRLFSEATYRALGYFDVYATERKKMIDTFRASGIDLGDDFPRWEAKEGFFYLPIHPRCFVLVDIIRRTMLGRRIDEQTHANAARFRETLTDHLKNMEAWPVYPDFAERIGFDGDLIWRRVKGHAELSLEEFVASEFQSLDAADPAWRQTPFVGQAASLLKPLVR